MNLLVRTGDVSVTVSASVAQELIARAGIEQDRDEQWVLPDGERTGDINVALRHALVLLAE